MKNLKDSLISGTASVGAKGQMVIPIKIRKNLNLKQGDTLIFVSSPNAEAFNVIKAESILDFQKQLTKLFQEEKRGNK